MDEEKIQPREKQNSQNGPPQGSTLVDPHCDIQGPAMEDPHRELQGPTMEDPHRELQGPTLEDPHRELQGPTMDDPHRELQGPTMEDHNPSEPQETKESSADPRNLKQASEKPGHALRRSATPGKKKSVAKKHVGLNDEEIERRRIRNNELERARQHAMQAAFSRLDEAVPDHMKISEHKDGSKMSSIENAIHYIKYLYDEKNFIDANHDRSFDPKHQRLVNIPLERNTGSEGVDVVVSSIGHAGKQHQAHAGIQGNQETNPDLANGHVNSVSHSFANGSNQNLSNGAPVVNLLSQTFASGPNQNLSNGAPVVNLLSQTFASGPNQNLSNGAPVVNPLSQTFASGAMNRSNPNIANSFINPMNHVCSNNTPAMNSLNYTNQNFGNGPVKPMRQNFDNVFKNYLNQHFNNGHINHLNNNISNVPKNYLNPHNIGDVPMNYLNPNFGNVPMNYLNENFANGPVNPMLQNFTNGFMNPLDQNFANGPMNHLDQNYAKGPLNHLNQNLGNIPMNPLNQNFASGPMNNLNQNLGNIPMNPLNQNFASGPINPLNKNPGYFTTAINPMNQNLGTCPMNPLSHSLDNGQTVMNLNLGSRPLNNILRPSTLNQNPGNNLVNQSICRGFERPTNRKLVNASREHADRSLTNSIIQQGNINIPRNPEKKSIDKENIKPNFQYPQSGWKSITDIVPPNQSKNVSQQQFNLPITSQSESSIQHRSLNHTNTASSNHGNVNETATHARSYESIDDLTCLSPDTIIRTLGPLVEDTPAVASSVSPSGSLSASSNQDSGFGTPCSDSPDGSSSRLPCLSPDTVSRALGDISEDTHKAPTSKRKLDFNKTL
ncbi:hypothetical protein EGW08_014986 [Elysia chlorotica]|uniref:BHLH domain-containing protein n=1 Tax=Elysia chlorotica TaxID=188477 RepID=A0A3S1HDM9_ELYCH|nr:hypothetical protein EGW08_014986 [Elysia chlorotica]